MATPRRLLVTGATGKQGGALISALLQKPSQPFEIYALTRDKASKKAEALARSPNVKVIEGNFKDVDAIFAQVKDVWGMFLVTTFEQGGVKAEEQQGKDFAASAVAAGAKHIVFTATDRGVNGDTDPTPIAHFKSKFNVEKAIEQRCRESKQSTTWTFLRPVAFMENLQNNFLGKAFVSMWRLNGMDRKLQLVSTKDVGKVAAEAFLNYDDVEYRNRAISIAGDSISPREAAKVFEEETGQPIPNTFDFMGRLLRYGLREALGAMFDWFRDVGFGVDVGAVRKRYGFMTDFRTWVREESAWKR